MAALAAAIVVAAVVMWQFVGLLGEPRSPAVVVNDAASAAASSAAIAPAMAPTPPLAVAVAPAPSPVASTQAATDAAVAAVAMSQGLAVPAKAASGDAGKPVALVAAGSSAAAAEASAASGARNKPSPVTGASRPDGSTAGGYFDGVPPKPADSRAKPVPATQRDPIAVAAPVPAAPTAPASAREACGDRLFIALAVCMDRECEQPRFRDQPECVKVLEMKRRREQR